MPVKFDFQLNCENRKLKYLSLSSRPCLDELLPSISDCIALETDTDAADAADTSPDTFSQYQQQVKGTNTSHASIIVDIGAVRLLHSNKYLLHLGVRTEGHGQQLVGGEEEFCLSDSRAAEEDRGADCTGEDTAGNIHISLYGEQVFRPAYLPAQYHNRCILFVFVTLLSPFQSEKDQDEMKELRETVAQQSKTIKRFNRGEKNNCTETGAAMV